KDLLMDATRRPAVYGELNGRLLNREALLSMVEVLVVVIENIQDSIIGFTQQTLKRNPPCIQKILTLVDDNCIVTDSRILADLQECMRQELIIERRIIRRFWKRDVGLLCQLHAKIVEIEDIQVVSWF